MSDRQSHPAAIARLRRRAKDVLNLLRGHDADAAAWLAGLHPAFRGLEPETVCGGSPRLADVQLAVARECGFGSWPQLRAHVGLSPTPELAPLRPVEADLIADPTYRSELAAAKGLAPVGAAAVSRHGVSYIVEDHVLAATTANLARCAGKRPDFRLDDLLPRIRFANLPARLANLLREVDTCTGKELVFLDTVPSLHPQTAIPGRHQVLNTQDPRCILFHLDAQDLHEIVLAHELGHIWLELVEGIEDFRVPRSLADLPRVTQLHLVQSFVLDIRVNALLAQRGFDLSVIDDAEQDALRTLAQQCALGKRIRTPRAAAALALTVASCLMDQGRWPASQQRDAQACLAMLREALPDLYCVAESHVASVARHGVADQAGIRRVVDECAAASFRLAGDVFDAERDLVEAPPSEWFVDKHPGFLPGVPLHAKLDIWRVMARRGLGPQVRYSVIRNNPHFAEIVLVGAGSGEPCPPSVTYSLPLSPPMAPPATPLVHLATPAASAPNWPPAAGVSLAPEGWPAPVLWDPLGRLTDGRGYMPGMGRWLSRVAFEEQELGEHPYGYGLNSPATQTDPSGLSPWADWSREHDLPSPITTVIEVGEGLREMSIEEYARAFETVLAANSAALGFKMLDYRDEPGFTGSKWAWRVFYVDVAFISGYTTCEAVNANKLKPWRKATRIRKYFRWQPRWTTEAGGWKPPHIDLLWRGRQIVIPLNPLRWKWWQK